MKLITHLKTIKRLGRLRKEENDDFRIYLRELPFSIKTIDQAVKTTSDAVSKRIDCTLCANCCRKLNPTLTVTDTRRLARHLGMTVNAFTARYLKKIQQDKKKLLIFQKRPCPFLKNNCCSIYEFRPHDCRSYPHLTRRGFVFRIRQAVEMVDVCPIVFNTYETLKNTLARRIRPAAFACFAIFSSHVLFSAMMG
ncbi:MAG: YkgJ family cysteine cluster protein [bacterium]